MSDTDPHPTDGSKYAVGDHVLWSAIPLVVCEVHRVGAVWLYACRPERSPDAEPLMYAEHALRTRDET